MPRITGYGEPGERDQLDYCAGCYPAAVRALNDDDMIDAEHPAYSDFGDYRCRSCKRLLTDDDN